MVHMKVDVGGGGWRRTALRDEGKGGVDAE